LTFPDEIDDYVVLKLSFDQYPGTSRVLGEEYEIAGHEVKSKVYSEEKSLLRSNFITWAKPYFGDLKGWEENSSIYMVYQNKLVGGVYLCSASEYADEEWGELQYAYVDPEHKGRGIYSILFNEAVKRARQWGLTGFILKTDRDMPIQLYIRWGAEMVERESKFSSNKYLVYILTSLRKLNNFRLIVKHTLKNRKANK